MARLVDEKGAGRSAELLERFAVLAIREDGAAIETRDRHYWKIEAITDELQWREGDEGCRRCFHSIPIRTLLPEARVEAVKGGAMLLAAIHRATAAMRAA